MYCLINASCKPTVLTQYPRAQNDLQNNVLFVFISSRWIRIALLGTTQEWQSLMNSHRQSRWLNSELGSGEFAPKNRKQISCEFSFLFFGSFDPTRRSHG